jgi:hypothetical protein
MTKVTSKCSFCNELTDEKTCPQCEVVELVTVYCCGLCGKPWFWRSSEKECCKKKKEEKKKERE